jgi:polyribonucleotide 5'-hydroxyl-kinase
VTVLVVLGSERLYSDMSRKYHGTRASSGEARTVVKLTSSGGCVDRDESYMKQARKASILEYFYGDAKTSLSPHSQTIDFGMLKVFKPAECKLHLPVTS